MREFSSSRFDECANRRETSQSSQSLVEDRSKEKHISVHGLSVDLIHESITLWQPLHHVTVFERR